ncbi:hypothetical protein CHS0354_010276, partial [Potamilus streckersoni]
MCEPAHKFALTLSGIRVNGVTDKLKSCDCERSRRHKQFGQTLPVFTTVPVTEAMFSTMAGDIMDATGVFVATETEHSYQLIKFVMDLLCHLDGEPVGDLK